ncbi:hypothetical protein BDF21DRAFT_425161 [Thamnidium elegans]|nr:hypothetical protein BDF21DRAFT_425161 [Thamnidium elegans]
MHYSLLILFFISLTHSLELQNNHVCNNTLALCYPTPNEIWYHYNHYTFIINQNYTLFNMTVYDLHLETILLENATEKSMKSWFNLTRSFFQIQVTDDWFPISLATGALNKTWQFNVSIATHQLEEEFGDSFPIQFNVIRFLFSRVYAKTVIGYQSRSSRS